MKKSEKSKIKKIKKMKILKNNIDFYFKTEDYFIFKDQAILHENCYYKNLNLIENIYSYLENCKLYIDEEDKIKKT